MSAAAAPQTEREILNSLHLSGRRRPWYASLFDEENNRGFGIRHLIVLIVTATISISVVSLFKSSASKVPTMPTSVGGGEKVVNSDAAAMSLHHLDFPKKPKTLFIVGNKGADIKECDRVMNLAEKAEAPLVVVVGGTGDDVQKYIDVCGKEDGDDETLVWMFAVDATIPTAMKKNILADNHYFSVVRKRAGYEILTAKSGPAASSSSAVGKRIGLSTLPKVLVTNSAIKMENPTPGLVRLATSKNAGGGATITLDLSDAATTAKREDTMANCQSMLLTPMDQKNKGLLSFSCIEKSN